MNLAKKLALDLIERCGYVLLKQAERQEANQQVHELTLLRADIEGRKHEVGRLMQHAASQAESLTTFALQLEQTQAELNEAHKTAAQARSELSEVQRIAAREMRHFTQSAASKLDGVSRELRMAQERAARDLEQARAEVWEVRQELEQARAEGRRELEQARTEGRQELERARAEGRRELEQARTEARDAHNRLAQASGEIRKLTISVEQQSQKEYRMLMRQQIQKAQLQGADPVFMSLYERASRLSTTSLERLYAMHKATEYISKAAIEGSIVECGVWRGSSMMMAALTLHALGDTDRKLILFDTFDGLPEDNETEATDVSADLGHEEGTRNRRTDSLTDRAFGSIEDVREAMLSTGYPAENIILVKGMVQATLPHNLPASIALLRLDTACHNAIICELTQLYPLLSDKGALLVYDYGDQRGQRKAVDEFFAKSGGFPLLTRIEYGGRVAVKTISAQ